MSSSSFYLNNCIKDDDKTKEGVARVGAGRKKHTPGSGGYHAAAAPGKTASVTSIHTTLPFSSDHTLVLGRPTLGPVSYS